MTMKISRKEYERVSLPWRVLEAVTDDPVPPWCVSPARTYAVTTCEVWRLRLVYPIAWPLVAALIVGVFGLLCILCPVGAVIVGLMRLAEKAFDLLQARVTSIKCDFVEWEPSND